MLRLLRSEALAYLRLGLLLPSRGRLAQNNGSRAEFGVIFVPGVGANGSHFINLARALAEESPHFEAFEYFSLKHPRRIADALSTYLEDVARRVERYLLVGHSLGGLLGRMVLQQEQPPPGLGGFVSLCAPLHGTWRSKLAPHPGLRSLRPDGALMEELRAGAHRLDRWRGRDPHRRGPVRPVHPAARQRLSRRPRAPRARRRGPQRRAVRRSRPPRRRPRRAAGLSATVTARPAGLPEQAALSGATSARSRSRFECPRRTRARSGPARRP